MNRITFDNNLILIATRNANYKIPINDLIYIESDLRIINIYTSDNTYTFYEKLDTLEQGLTGYGFIRCHQSYLVSASHILCFDNHLLQLNDSEITIPVSRQHKQAIRRYMQQTGQHGILTCIEGQYAGYSVKMKPEQRILIGRDGNLCDIVIQIPLISRLHCEITFHEDISQYEITNRSSNGTFIYGDVRLIPKQHYAVEPGTELCFGDTTTIFKLL